MIVSLLLEKAVRDLNRKENSGEEGVTTVLSACEVQGKKVRIDVTHLMYCRCPLRKFIAPVSLQLSPNSSSRKHSSVLKSIQGGIRTAVTISLNQIAAPWYHEDDGFVRAHVRTVSTRKIHDLRSFFFHCSSASCIGDCETAAMEQLTWIMRRLETLSGVLDSVAARDNSVKKRETKAVRNMLVQEKKSKKNELS
jgi:hypothetical protein